MFLLVPYGMESWFRELFYCSIMWMCPCYLSKARVLENAVYLFVFLIITQRIIHETWCMLLNYFPTIEWVPLLHDSLIFTYRGVFSRVKRLIWTYFFFNCIMWFWVVYTGLHYPGLKLNTASEDFPGRRLFWEGENIPWLTYYIQWKREFGQKNNWPHYLPVLPHRSVFAFFFPLYGILFPHIHKSFTAHLSEIFTQML